METKKILIVEDDTDTRLWLAVLLKQAGYQTVACEDGAMAMTVLVKEMPDLVMLDMGLPAGDGMFVLQNMRKHIDFCAVPVMVLSGAPHYTAEKVLEAGATCYFQKPIDNQSLLNAVEKCFLMSAPTVQAPSAPGFAPEAPPQPQIREPWG